MALFTRVRTLINGTSVEDIQYHSKLVALDYTLFHTHERNVADLMEMPWAEETALPPLARRDIPGGASVRFSCPLLCGLANQPLYLWLKAAPLTFEFEMTPNPRDIFAPTTSATNTAGNYSPWGGATARNQDNFTLSDAVIRCDMLTIDNSLVEQYASHLLAGRPLSIPFTSFVNIYQVLPDRSTFTLQMMRALSRIKNIFWCFAPQVCQLSPPICPANVAITGLATGHQAADAAALSTAAQPATLVANDNMQWQLQIGGRCWPQMPCRGITESYYRLRSCLDQTQHGTFAITPNGYRTSQTYFGVDLEKAAVGSAGASFTGLSTRGGEALVLIVNNLSATTTAAGQFPQVIFAFVHADLILNVTASGAEVLE
jgi:hypothetical protein